MISELNIVCRSQVLFIALASMCILSSQVYSQQYRVVEYGLNSGLPQSYVYSIDQDGSGFLWIGTGDGLARFDGKHFQVFTMSDSLGDNFITASHINESGAWFGHMNGGVTHFDGKQFIKVLPGDQSKGSITDIKSMAGSTWASTQSGGIWRINPDLRASLYEDRENPVVVFSFEMISSTECIVGSMEGVYIYAIPHDSRELRLIGAIDSLPETKVQDLHMSADQETLYILTEDEGIFTFDYKGFNLRARPLKIEMEAFIEGPQQVFEDKEMNLWIATFGEGLYKLSRDSKGTFNVSANYNEENGLPGNNVKYVFQDREENIWIGMYGTGLVRLVDEAYSYHLSGDGVSNNVHSILITDTLRWFGTESGLLRVNTINGEQKLFAGRQFGLPDDIVTAISNSPEGELWIGTMKNGVYRMRPGSDRFNKFFISPEALENTINALEVSSTVVWVATNKGLCKINTEDGNLTWFTIRNGGLPHNTVKNLQIDESGRVWLSTLSNTITYVENDSVTRLIIPMVGAALDIRSITRDKQGNTWVGTYGNGVLKIDGDSASIITSADGLLSDYCYSLVSDDLRYIWVSHQGGLSRIRLSDGFVSTVKEEMGIDRNMKFNENAVFKDSGGKLWFGSTSGVLAYDPHMEKDQPPAPALSITSIMVDDRPMEVTRNLDLPVGRHDIRIRFQGIYLKNPGTVTYRYNMEGLGNTWSEEFTDNQVMFNSLPDGKYTFNLTASNSEGISNEDPVKLHIFIARPLWKRWWVYALILSMATIAIVTYIKRREYHLLMEKQILEKRVRERTGEVVKQKEEIEVQRDAIKTQNDRIQQINKNITDSINYARRIQQAVFTPPEELARMFPDSFVFSRPRYIVSGDFFWLAKKENKLVVTVSDCTGHGVPGAFMSMLGITLLNKLVNTQGITEADLILNKLKQEIIDALKQKSNSESSSDGMDMALFVYDPASSMLQYSGGFSPMVHIHNGELSLIKADPMPIGIGAIVGKDFTSQEIKIHKGDVVYLYSDGYEDQFGGENDRKFSRKQFRELLADIHALPMAEQRSTLEKAMDDWMDGRDQIDDITVMGIRF